MDQTYFTPTLAEAFDLAGLPFPGEPEPGRMLRFSTNGRDRTDRAGWLKLLPDAAGAAFGCWRAGLSYCWQHRDSNAPPPSPEERAEARQRAEKARHDAEQERAEAYAQAAKECAGLWAALAPAPAAHDYLQRKGIAPHLARVDPSDKLVLPVFDDHGDLQSLQSIAPDGAKRFHTGGKMAGGRLYLGKPRDGQPLVLAEGFATGASIHEAASLAVVVGFAGSNLRHVAESLRSQFPNSSILVAGDLDAHGAGRKYAEAAAEAGKPARLTLPRFRDGREAGDFNDLASDEGYEEVRRQILAALRPEPAFPFTPARDLLTGPKGARWLVRGWIEAGSLALLFGESTAGKSFQALDWAACIATATPWNGCAVQAGPVFYVAGEGKPGIGRRLAAWETHHGKPLVDAPLYVSGRGAALMDEAEALAIAQSVRQLSELHGAPALVVVDTLHRNMGQGDENSAEDVAAFLANIDRAIREPLGCAVLLVHHSGHGDKTRSRGSSAIRAALDAEFSLTLEGDLRRLECTKQKDHEPPPALTLEALAVSLPEPWIDEETGEPLASLVLVPTESTAEAITKAKLPGGGNMRIAWDRLGELLRQSMHYGQASAPATRPCVELEAATADIAERLTCDPKRRRERTEAAITNLVARGLLVHEEGWLWCR